MSAALRQIDEDAPEDQERAAVDAACSRAGLSPDQAQAAFWLLGDLSDARADLEALPPDDLAELLRELVETGDPSDTRPADPAAVRAEQIRVLLACPKPGHTITPDLAAAIVDGMAAWHRLKVETAEQRAIREAFNEARRLMTLHGDRDPRTMDAVIKALELQDPGCWRKTGSPPRTARPRVSRSTAWNPLPTRWAPMWTTWWPLPRNWRPWGLMCAARLPGDCIDGEPVGVARELRRCPAFRSITGT